MGSILAFRPRKSAKTRSPGDNAPATVIIFPGVRYEQLGSVGEAMKWSPVDWRVWQRPNPMPAN